MQVDCSEKGLEALPSDIDVETQVLDISENNLRILPENTFRRAGLLNLQRIYVRAAKLRRIDPGAFNELINLVDIDLSDNELKVVPYQAFRSTPFLR